MLKKSIPILSLIAAVALLLIAANALTNLPEPQNPAESIESQKQIVINYIECANSVSAQVAFNKLLADYGDNELVVPAAYQIGEKFREKAQYKSAISAHKYIVDNFPESEHAVWAQRGLASSYIGLGDSDSAEIETQKLIDNYISDPNIAQVVFEVADTYCWFGKNDKARPLYQMVIDTWPAAQHSMWSQMGIAISYIADGNDSAALDAADKLIQTYPDNENLAEALFYIGARFEWARNYDNAINVFNYIVENFQESTWAENAAFDIAKSNIYRFVEGKDEPNALAAIDSFIDIYKNKPELAAAVYDFAARADWINGFEPNGFTEAVFNKFIDNFPQNPQVVNAQMSLARMDIISLIDCNEDPNALLNVDRFVSDFNDIGREAGINLCIIAEKFYHRAGAKHREVLTEEGKEDYRKAIGVWKQIAENLIGSTYIPQAYFCQGVIYSQELGEYQEGIKFLRKYVNSWPDDKYAWHGQYLIGKYLEKWKNQNHILDSEIEEQIVQAYEAVIENYPHSDSAPRSVLRLFRINYSQRDWSNAAKYLSTYIEHYANKDDKEKYIDLLETLAFCYEKVGSYNSSIDVYIEIAEYLSDSNDKRFNAILKRIEELEDKVK